MNPLLEVNPETCIIIVGPLVSRSCLSVVPNSLKLTYKSLMLAGLEMVRVQDRGRLEGLFQVNFDAASEELNKVLKEQGDLEKWISICSSLQSSLVSKNHPPLLQSLLQMQSRGCRLIYTHYDNILDAVAGMIPILPTNDVHLDQWIEGHLNGFLHIHGHYSDVDSLILHSTAYDTFLAEQNFFTRLQEFFKRRTIILIGHDPNHLNPLLIKMSNVLLLDDNMRNPPLFVSSTTNSVPPCFLHLPITEREEDNLHDLLVCGAESSFVIGRASDKQVDKEIVRSQAVLIFSEKQSFRKLGDIIYQLNQSGEIYVRRDALTVLFGNRIMYGNILTYGGSGLHRIWQLVIPAGSVFRSKGLIALGLQNSLLIWINKKPSNLGPITEVNTFHSLWNNSVAIMKTQAQTTSTTIPATLSSSKEDTPHVSPSLFTPPGQPFSYHPLFPSHAVMSPQLFQSMPTQVPRQLFTSPANNLSSNMYQFYTISGVPLGQQSTSRTTSESSSLADSTSDAKMESTSIVDIDTSRDSVSEGESKETSCPVCLRTESPVLLKEFMQETLISSEEKIISCINPTTTQSSTVKPVTRPSSLSIISTGSQTQVVGTESSSTMLLQNVVKPVTQGLVTQVPVITTAPQRPSLIPISPSMLPLTTPTLPYPLTFSPYSLLPSVIHSEQPRPQYYVQLLPSNAVSTVTNVPSVIPYIKAAPTTIQSCSPSIINPSLHYSLATKTFNPLSTQLSESSSSRIHRNESPLTGTLTNDQNLNTQQVSTDDTDCRSMHLWEFVLHLLLTPNHGNTIQWTGDNYEFFIIDPQGLSKMWAEVTGKAELNFNNLLGILRSYSGLGILELVEERKMTYTFVMDIQKYMSIYGHKIVDLTKNSES